MSSATHKTLLCGYILMVVFSVSSIMMTIMLLSPTVYNVYNHKNSDIVCKTFVHADKTDVLNLADSKKYDLLNSCEVKTIKPIDYHIINTKTLKLYKQCKIDCLSGEISVDKCAKLHLQPQLAYDNCADIAISAYMWLTIILTFITLLTVLGITNLTIFACIKILICQIIDMYKITDTDKSDYSRKYTKLTEEQKIPTVIQV